MNQQDAGPHGLIGMLVPLLVIAVVLFFRFRRMSKVRPLRLDRLWILPAVYGAFMVVMFVSLPPRGMGWAWVFLALALGAGAGWIRGMTMHIGVDPETHALDHAQSPAAIAFLLLLVLVRSGSRMLLQADGGLSHEATMLLTDALLAFAMGMFSLQRLEMFLRAKRLLAEVRGAHP